MPAATSKPVAPAGMLCPMFQQDVSEVCHKCNLYAPLRVQKIENGAPVVFDDWDCAHNHARIVGRDIGQAVHEVAAATEQARNKYAADASAQAEQTHALVADLRDAFAGMARMISAVGGYIAGASARPAIPDNKTKG